MSSTQVQWQRQGVCTQLTWLADRVASLTTQIDVETPSECAERIRYLRASNMPGYFRFAVCPYMREIVDCLSVDSPIREVALMKGVQICATTAGLENGILYGIEHVKTAPMMLVTADGNLAKTRLDSYVIPMIQASGLSPLITSADEGNSRKTGKTSKRIEWLGGGFLLPLGAQNPNAFRSIPIRFLFRDEIDGWPLETKDGDPIELTTARTKSYEDSRKIFDLSTPALAGTSKIEKQHRRGDQRKYFVRCLKCDHAQVLRWRHVDKDTGVVSGITWDMNNEGQLVPGSVRYLCINCQHPHTNEDKARLLSPECGAEWRPTAIPEAPHIRSYHISALYSPVGMQSWEACVRDWLAAWDVVNNRVKDPAKLQVFYNNVLGEPFEMVGDKVQFSQVSPHRRGFYRYGEVPNKWAVEHAGSPILLTVCTVDVHRNNLAVAVWGWCRGRRVFLLDYWRFEGNTETPNDPSTWGRLSELLETKEYVADDGKRYRIEMAMIDSGYLTDHVYKFCAQYETGVFPIKGHGASQSRVAKHFMEGETPMGHLTFGVTVDLYKDRWGAALRMGWDKHGLQPEGFFNAPSDATDKQLKELTVEKRGPLKNQRTGEIVGWTWHRPNGVENELWDLLVYGSAAHDILANFVIRELGLEQLDETTLNQFYDMCEYNRLYFYE